MPSLNPERPICKGPMLTRPMARPAISDLASPLPIAKFPGYWTGMISGVLIGILLMGIIIQWHNEVENNAQTQSLIGQIEGGPRR